MCLAHLLFYTEEVEESSLSPIKAFYHCFFSVLDMCLRDRRGGEAVREEYFHEPILFTQNPLTTWLSDHHLAPRHKSN